MSESLRGPGRGSRLRRPTSPLRRRLARSTAGGPTISRRLACAIEAQLNRNPLHGSRSNVAWPAPLGPARVGSPTKIASVCRSRSLAALTAAEKVPRPMITNRCPRRLISSFRINSCIKARLSSPLPPSLRRRSMTRFSTAARGRTPASAGKTRPGSHPVGSRRR